MSSLSSRFAQTLGNSSCSVFPLAQRLVLPIALTVFAANASAAISDTQRISLATQGNSALEAVNRALNATKTYNDQKAAALNSPQMNPSGLRSENFDLSKFFPDTADPKAVFSIGVAEVEAYCANVVSTLSASIKQEKHKAAKLNSGGLLLAAIGAVTGNPPYKTLLVAIGISGGGDSKSVFSVLAGSSSEDASLDQADLDLMRTNYQSAMTAYRAVNPKDDVGAEGRWSLLISAKSACDNLWAPLVATPPAGGASGPKATAPAAGASDPAAIPPATGASDTKKP